MSAIFGVYNLDGKAVASQLLERMSGVLAHRGSDDAGVWNDGAVGLGHRMLWTTPESLHEKLPLKSNESAVVVTCDVRLDNRDELIAELSLSSKPADEIADGEIILKAYERWGEDCPAKLIGDFAFVVWDERRRQLFCARDHFGVKPFNYFASEKCFAFASEAKALFQIEAVSRGLDEGMIADYFIGNFENKTKTFYQKILRLPPAHSLTIRVDGEPRLQCYYRLDPHLEAPMRSNDEYAEGLREIFNEAVRCRMRRTKSLGTKLSGGLDSSSIACVARDLLREQGGDDSLPTFSLVYDRNKKCDEREYINCVLSQGGFEPHFISGEEQTSPLSNLKTICWHADRPAIAPGGSSAWKLRQRRFARL
jgi:asparagine synthase (glutamine-hydrolysing)